MEALSLRGLDRRRHLRGLCRLSDSRSSRRGADSPPSGIPSPQFETYPFFSTWHDLAGNGYVEGVYLSKARRTRTRPPAESSSPMCRTKHDCSSAGRSPVLLQRHRLVEWQNVTAGYDLDALWNRRRLREGYAWVGVSVQRVGVNQLRGWSPTRYGSLDVTC